MTFLALAHADMFPCKDALPIQPESLDPNLPLHSHFSPPSLHHLLPSFSYHFLGAQSHPAGRKMESQQH